jgi:hypothetical protein
MTKQILFLLCTLFVVSLKAQNTFSQMHAISIQQPPYNYMPHGVAYDVFEIDVSPNFYDGYLLFGGGVLRSASVTLDYRRALAMKVNTNGDLMYMREYNDIDTTMETSFGAWYYSSVVQDHNENYRAIMTLPDGVASFRRYMLTTDLFGDPIDLVLIDSVYSNDRHFTTFFDHRDSTVLAGLGINPENADALDHSVLWKLDTLGNTIWKKEYEACYVINSIVENPNGGYIVGGVNVLGICNDLYPDDEVVVIGVDENGEEEARWSQNNFCVNEIIHPIPIDNDQIVIIGKMNPEEYDGIAPWTGDLYSSVLEYQNGQLIEVGEQKIYYRESAPVIPMQAKKLSDDSGYMFTGSGSFTEYDQLVGYLAKIDNNRDSVWFRAYVYFEPLENSLGNGWHYLNSFKESSDGGFVAAGYIQQRGNNPNPLLNSPWVVKVDEYGCIEPGCHLVNVEEIVIGLENTMSAFPNPASDYVTIQFENATSNSLRDKIQEGELILFNMQGREVYRTNTRSVGSGGQMTIDIQHLPAGLYTAQWISGNQWLDSVKILVTRY